MVELFAKHNGLTLEKALDVFYHSDLYKLMSEGVSDMHCMSDEYLVQELEEEQKTKIACFCEWAERMSKYFIKCRQQ